MTFDERLKAYIAKTKRIEARGRAIRNILVGVAVLMAGVAKLVSVLVK